MNNYWELNEALKALNDGNESMARHYLEKAQDKLLCMHCKQPIEDGQLYSEQLRGNLHLHCAKAYEAHADRTRD